MPKRKDQSSAVTEASIKSVVEKLDQLEKGLPFEEQAALRLLMSRVDRTVLSDYGPEELMLPNIRIAAQEILSRLVTPSDMISFSPSASGSWVRGGPLWARWSSRTS